MEHVQASMSVAVETIFADRALSCIFVHGSSQLRGAVETIFSNRTFSDIFGHVGASALQLVKEQPPTNNGRAARQGYQWRNMFFEKCVSNLKTSKQILSQPRFSLFARCALERALRSARSRLLCFSS
jgi:hypothetical protein